MCQPLKVFISHCLHCKQAVNRCLKFVFLSGGHSKLVRKKDTIIKQIAGQRFTRDLAEKLLGAKMIGSTTYYQAKNYATGVVEVDRATALFNAVVAGVELNPAKYGDFIRILKQIQGSDDLVAFINR